MCSDLAAADYYTRPPGIVSLVMLTITYIQAMAIHIHRQGRFNNHTARSRVPPVIKIFASNFVCVNPCLIVPYCIALH